MSQNLKPVNHKRIKHCTSHLWDVTDLCENIAAHGDKIAYRYYVGKDIRTMTYAELGETIHKTAAAFNAMGLAGEKVAVIGDTSPQWVSTYIAAMAAGCVIVPMDKELHIEEIDKFFKMVDVKAVVYSKGFNEGFIKLISSEDTCVKYFIPVSPAYDNSFSNKVIAFDDVVKLGEERIAREGYNYPIVTDRGALAEMLFTSGTTGTSKCVMLSQTNVFSVVNSAMATVPFTPDDVIVSVLPVHHTYELACMMTALVIGMEICINDSLRHVMKNFALFKPTGLVLVPLFVNTMYKKIWSEAERTHKDGVLRGALKTSRAMMAVGIDARRKLFKSVHAAFGGRLEKIICGGARLNPELIAAFEDFGISIYEGFGITECAPLTCVTPYYARKYGSVGPAVPCCRVRISDEFGDGQIGEHGYVEGELQVKGDNVMLGYYNNPDANEAAFTEDGWFRTGDIAYMDEDGYVYITGRMKSVIVLENGKNVFPEEIEEYLEDVESIAECVVVGRKATDSDEVILTAVIYPDRDKFPAGSSDELITNSIRNSINQLNRGLPGFKQIRNIELRKTEFEKTTSKKIKRHLVK